MIQTRHNSALEYLMQPCSIPSNHNLIKDACQDQIIKACLADSLIGLKGKKVRK